jgi:glutathione S-transferase
VSDTTPKRPTVILCQPRYAEVARLLAADPADPETAKRIKRREEKVAAVRAVIAKHLAALADDLGQFEQTCHAILFGSPPPVAEVAARLVEAHDTPTAYAISELTQTIEAFVKVEKPA